MKKALLGSVLVAAAHWLCAAQVVAAEDEPKAEKAEAAEEPETDLGHGGQFNVRAALVAGYRMVLRYDESPYCREYDLAKSAQDQQKFCGHGAPLAIDLALGFAPLDFIEPYAWLRFGFAREEETRTEPVVIVGAGARIYTMSDSAFKIYAEPAIGFELEGGGYAVSGSPVSYAGFDYKKDLVFHFAAGPQLDFAENFGLFADAGLTVGILRAIHASLELKAGLQARFP